MAKLQEDIRVNKKNMIYIIGHQDKSDPLAGYEDTNKRNLTQFAFSFNLI